MNNPRPAGSLLFTLPVDGRRRYFVKSIFILLLLLNIFVPAEISSAFYVAVMLFGLVIAGWKIKRGLISLVSPFFFLFLLGVLEAQRHPLFDVMKDFWYLAKIVFALGAGYLLMQHLRSFQQLCRLVVAAAVIAAMIHLFNVVLDFQSGTSIMDLRNEAGGGYFITTIGLGLLVGVTQLRNYIGFTKLSYYLSVVLCAGSLIASGSRTYIISFILLFFILRGWGKLNLKTFLILALLGAVVTAVYISASFDSNQINRSLLDKFAHSTSEVAISNYEDMSDISLNWRGFESYRAYLTYLDGNYFEKMFGQGFGSLVDLGFYIPLGGEDATPIRYIPILHNGYMYVLIKYGLLGVITYLYFLYRLIRVVSHVRIQQSFDSILALRLISSLGWVFLFSTIVITGVFNKSQFDSSLIILGAVFAWLNMDNGRKIFSTIHSDKVNSSILV
jgi:hypothetical protein